MPELPEVEHLRRSLVPLLVGRTVTAATLHRPDILTPPPQRSAPRRADLLHSARITDILRLGKQLALLAHDGRVLCLHLGMSGQVIHHLPHSPLPTHVHARWTLDDRSTLLFRDPRRFGGLWAFNSYPDLLTLRWSSLGPDALTIDPHDLHTRLARTRRALKPALLDQSLIAGVGNIYADESLFLARLSPLRPAPSLSPADSHRLADALRSTLQTAIHAGGSTLRDYVDASGSPGSAQLHHAVYGRSDLPCTACATPLTTITLAQRTTVYCDSCQI